MHESPLAQFIATCLIANLNRGIFTAQTCDEFVERVTYRKYMLESVKRYYSYFDLIGDGFVPSSKKLILSKIIFLKTDEDDQLYVQIHSHQGVKTTLLYN